MNLEDKKVSMEDKMITRNILFKAVLVAVLCMFTLPLFANATSYTYSFDGITNNNDGNVTIGEAQLKVIVTDQYASNGKILFIFYNTGLSPCTIGTVYFDFDGSYPSVISSLLGLIDFDDDILGLNLQNTTVDIGGTIYSNSEVDFKVGVINNNTVLPGGNGNSISFEVSAFTDVDKNIHDGVSQSEWLGVVLGTATISGSEEQHYGIEDVIFALSEGYLRIGLHVQSIGSNGESESFINISQPDGGGTPPLQVVPEPGTLLLVGFGVTALGVLGRRRSIRSSDAK
jgi:hypothetical protein